MNGGFHEKVNKHIHTSVDNPSLSLGNTHTHTHTHTHIHSHIPVSVMRPPMLSICPPKTRAVLISGVKMAGRGVGKMTPVYTYMCVYMCVNCENNTTIEKHTHTPTHPPTHPANYFPRRGKSVLLLQYSQPHCHQHMIAPPLSTHAQTVYLIMCMFVCVCVHASQVSQCVSVCVCVSRYPMCVYLSLPQVNQCVSVSVSLCVCLNIIPYLKTRQEAH